MATVTTIRVIYTVNEYLGSGENRTVGPIVHSFDKTYSWESGTGTDQTDLVWSNRSAVASGGNDVIDLRGGITDTFGTSIAMAKGCAVLMYNRDTTDGEDFRIGPDATNGWVGPWLDASDRTRVPAGGLFLWVDPNGQAIAAGSTDELYVENNGSTENTYDIFVSGKSA
jgi:hypothetical protein